MKVIIGQHYSVPCVRRPLNRGWLWLPIIGGRHPDPELDNPRPHYHIDIRFFTDKLLKWACGGEYKPEKIKVFSSDIELPIKHRRLRCYRQFELARLPYPGATINNVPFKEFEKLFVNAEIVVKDGCRFCPHKGMPLDGALESRYGTLENAAIVQCPGHGLYWNMHTGKLVSFD